MKGFFGKRIATLAAGFALAAAVPACAAVPAEARAPLSPEQWDNQERGFVPNEAAAAEEFFGDLGAAKYARMNFSMTAKGLTRAEVESSDLIQFYGVPYSSMDYTREGLFNFGMFYHEVWHLLQFQSEDFGRGKDHIYDYSLTPETDFKKLYAEQQSAVIEDYARRFLHPEHGPSRRMLNTPKDTPETDALLRNIVEKNFPGAKKARLAAEKRDAVIVGMAGTGAVRGMVLYQPTAAWGAGSATRPSASSSAPQKDWPMVMCIS